MLTFLFQFTGTIEVGQYLLGSPKFEGGAVELVNARLIATVGTSVLPTVFQLEINGDLVDKKFPVVPKHAGQMVNLVFRINRKLAEDDEIRIKCVSCPDVAEGLSTIGFNLTAREASTLTEETGEMYVRWVNGSENIRILEYNPATHLFTETSSGISSGRASIANATTFQAIVDGEVAAECNAVPELLINELMCVGSTGSNETPRIEFWIGATRIASLTKTGRFYVLDIVESASVTGGSTFFEFYGAGALAAVLGPAVDTGVNILTAFEVREPTTS
jgi:hypothetical protein